jgi:hypothetical protein
MTQAGSTLFAASGGITTMNPAVVTGYKCALPFDMLGMITSLTTYCNFPGGSGNIATLDSYYQLTGTAAKPYIPWAGSILGFGVAARQPRTAGYVSFTILNGTTSLVTITLNSTNTKTANSGLLTAGAKPFTASNLRVRAKSSAAWAPTTANAFGGVVWVSI